MQGLSSKSSVYIYHLLLCNPLTYPTHSFLSLLLLVSILFIPLSTFGLFLLSLCQVKFILLALTT